MKIVLKSNFIQPKVKDQVWIKQDLLYKYKSINDYNLMVIKGRLGAGKTTSLSYFLEQNYEEKIYWYSINDKNEDKIKFWRSIIEAFRFNDLEIKEATTDLVSKLTAGKLKVKEVINRLLDTLRAKLNGDAILVIDNFHVLNNKPSLLNTLSYFIEQMSKDLHCVIISRLKVDLPKLPYWKIKKKAILIEDKDFLLNQEQIKALFLNQYQLNLGPSQIKKINELSQGWPLVIDLIAKKMKAGISLEEIITNQENFQLLFNYLRVEFLDKLALDVPNSKEFLLKTSLLKDIKVDICDKLLKINNSSQLLEELIDKTGLITKEKSNYQYHPILHNCLQQEAKEVYDFNQIYNKLKKISYQTNSFEQLVYYIINNDSKDKIIELVLDQGENWLTSNKYKLMDESLSYLPKESFFEYPRLFIYQGDLYFYQLKVHSALDCYQQAEDLLVTPEDLISLWLKIAKLYAWANSNKLFIYLKKIRDYKAELSLKEKRELSYLKIIAKMIRGEFKKANSLLESYVLADSIYLELKANLSFMQGNLTKARRLADKLANNQLADYLLYNTIFLPVFNNLFTGEVYQAQEYIWNELNENIPLMETFINYYLLQTEELLQIEDSDKYKKEYTRFFRQIESCPFSASWYRMELLSRLAHTATFIGDYKTGINYFKQGLKLIKQREDNLYEAIFKKGLGLNYYYNGKEKEGISLLQQARNIFNKINNNFNLVVTELLLALIYYKQDQRKEFKEHIKLSLQVARENNYDYLFLKPTIEGIRDPNKIVPLLTTATSLKIEAEYVNKLLNKLEINRADSHPGYSLKVRALGEFKLYCGQKEVAPQEWKRKKARELFELLLVKRNKFIARDRICELLWPNKALKTAKQNFYVALNRLNKILEPNRTKGEAPFFVIKNDSSYKLNTAITYFYDVELFEELITRGKNSNTESVKINYYKQALKLYQGQFLEHNLYARWTIRERERLENLFLDIAAKLIEYYYQKEGYKTVIELANKILQIDNYFEKAYLYKVKSYIQLRRRDLAIKTYLECKKILKQELGVEPNSKLQKHYQIISV
ncbi:ATP-dependent transcriptional regulator [Halobacteroides halobius DSM 5150]|uniref:ATP-dependent transcriptional regulator n=1 Tax=Halobacteroides halobius (strain ATCC 35273 / DSM 5150 / MD-1) TaxID=748449 RepID=L0K6U7_HALHC|nr:BTAD domain-containing putative transcriptional regulator [Halobacteroides halobius]AGB40746.1 ATP-dependent transcriptional regulator [Halobacteroides halobius DSM 5150]